MNMDNKPSHRVQKTLAIWAFVFAVLFGIAGFATPPPGEIDESVLYLCAQFLLLAASLLGVSAMVKK